MEITLKKNERIDDLQLKGLKIIQNTEGFCFGMDAVLLANFATVKRGAKVADLGTGTGIIPILISGKSRAEIIYGVEIQEEVYEMACRSVEMNGISDRVKIINADIKNIEDSLGKNSFSVVTSNPPYMHVDGVKNPDDRKMISRHEVKCNLDDVVRAASLLLQERGKFYMVHRPTRLIDIIMAGRKYRMEPKVMRFVHPRYGKAPNMILVEFVKGGKPDLKIMDPLYVYNEDGSYTDEINEIYSNESIER